MFTNYYHFAQVTFIKENYAHDILKHLLGIGGQISRDAHHLVIDFRQYFLLELLDLMNLV